MSFGAKSQEEIIELLRKSYEKLTMEVLTLSEEKNRFENAIKEESFRAEERLIEQKTHYQSLIDDQKRRIGELEDQVKNLQNEQNSNHRKEVRKYVENINEKEIQLNNLKRQINSLKNKISSLEQQLNNMINVKENYEIFVLKTIEQIKSRIKELSNFVDDIENEKMILSSKFRQLTQKIVLLENQNLEIKGKKKNLKENYNNLQNFYKASKDQCLKLKFEVEKLKQMNNSDRPIVQIQTKIEDEFMIAKNVEQIIELKNLITSCESYLLQTNEFSEMNKSLISENTLLKIKISEIQREMNDIKIKFQSGYEDELLKIRQPSLYEYFLRKKEQIKEFEKTMEKIEAYMEEKDEKVNNIINMMTKQTDYSSQRGEEVQKLTSQLTEVKKRIDFFNEYIQKLKKQNQVLQEKIIKYVQEMKDIINQKPQQRKKAFSKARCRYCYLSFEKNDAIEICQDCKKKFHEGHCSLHHTCDSYSFQEGTSNYSGIGE